MRGLPRRPRENWCFAFLDESFGFSYLSDLPCNSEAIDPAVVMREIGEVQEAINAITGSTREGEGGDTFYGKKENFTGDVFVVFKNSRLAAAVLDAF